MADRLLNRQEILDVEDFQYEDVPVPEWHGVVRVKGLTGTERDDYEGSVMQMTKKGRPKVDLANARAKLVQRAVIDEEGNLVFTDNDVARLGKKSALALSRVYEKAAELSGLSDDDLEELVGNSNAVQNDSSTSDSPES